MRTQDIVNVSEVNFAQVNLSYVNASVFGGEGIGTGSVVPVESQSWLWNDGTDVLWGDGDKVLTEKDT